MIMPEVNTLMYCLCAALYEEGKSGRVVHITHLQGLVIVWLVARKLQPEEWRHIKVISFGSAATMRTLEFPTMPLTTNTECGPESDQGP